MQLKIQQEKKEEIDRLKTQYTFKAYNHLTSTEGPLLICVLPSV